MISADVIRQHLLDRLEPIYGKPKNAAGLADELANHVAKDGTATAMEELAARLIASRKAKGFPSASELIAAVKFLPPPRSSSKARTWETNKERIEREKAEDAAERAAIRLLGGALARRAVAEGWAPGLIEFTRKQGRAPQADEEGPIIILSRENDEAAQYAHREAQGPFAGFARGLVGFRRAMHERAAKDLGV